jgi:hypothetical protein
MIRRSASLLVALSLLFAAAPLTPTGGFAPSTALAKGGGGNGGGNGGGHGGNGGNGTGGSHGNSADHAQSASAAGHGQTDDQAQAKAAARSTRASPAKLSAAARELGNLNAVHASATARANAAPTSMVGKIAAYETAMRQALAITNPASRALAINAARADLAAAANKPLTGAVVTRVDRILGLPTGRG